MPTPRGTAAVARRALSPTASVTPERRDGLRCSGEGHAVSGGENPRYQVPQLLPRHGRLSSRSLSCARSASRSRHALTVDNLRRGVQHPQDPKPRFWHSVAPHPGAVFWVVIGGQRNATNEKREDEKQ